MGFNLIASQTHVTRHNKKEVIRSCIWYNKKKNTVKSPLFHVLCMTHSNSLINCSHLHEWRALCYALSPLRCPVGGALHNVDIHPHAMSTHTLKDIHIHRDRSTCWYWKARGGNAKYQKARCCGVSKVCRQAKKLRRGSRGRKGQEGKKKTLNALA